MAFSRDQWAVILGGSSGFGLATARRLAEQGMSIFAVHRDRRAMLAKIEPEFEKIRAAGAQLISRNVDALSAEKRVEIIDQLAEAMGSQGRVRVLMHSIAFGNLKLLVSEAKRPRDTARALAEIRFRLSSGSCTQRTRQPMAPASTTVWANSALWPAM